jgi:2-polyprenyl-3-methyl-5-hydroxy-6-metoxy-1,4-benzoquinol methylase
VQTLADYVASTDRFDRYGQIVRCEGCGLVYTNPRPAARSVRRSYAETADHEYMREDASRSINAHMSLHTIKRHARGGRLLDVGCATGYFLNAARIDFEVVGVEPSSWAADYARSRLHLDVMAGHIESVDLPLGTFDVITMNDVIEHFSDPKVALQRAATLLRPGGILYLVTPDIGSLSARLMRGRWWGLRPAHLYYFSRRTLSALLEQCGFEVARARSFGRIFTYGYWLSRIRTYPKVIYRFAALAIRTLGIEEKFLYLDTRDSMEICAVERR